MSRALYFFLFFLQAIALTLTAFADEDQNELLFLSLQRNEGATVGDKISYTTLEAFAFPFNYQNFWPFLDLRYHGFGESRQNAANAGLGFRITPNFTDFIFGANAYYDYTNIHNRPFHQVGMGLEMLGCVWNFRLNGYLPVGKKTRLKSTILCAKYTKGRLLIRENYVDSLKGMNFEAEAFLTNICCTDIYLAFGGYYYKGTKCRGNILGSEYRLTLYPFKCFSFSLTATHDRVYKTRIQGQVDLTFLFKSICAPEDDFALFQPVRRHEMIVLDKHNMWIWNW